MSKKSSHLCPSVEFQAFPVQPSLTTTADPSRSYSWSWGHLFSSPGITACDWDLIPFVLCHFPKKSKCWKEHQDLCITALLKLLLGVMMVIKVPALIECVIPGGWPCLWNAGERLPRGPSSAPCLCWSWNSCPCAEGKGFQLPRDLFFPQAPLWNPTAGRCLGILYPSPPIRA